MPTVTPTFHLPNMPKPPKVYPKLNSRLRIAMWIAFIGGPVAMLIGGYEYYRIVELRTHGEEVPGVVLGNSTLDTGKGRTSYRLTLEYSPPEHEITYEKEFVVTKPVYDRAIKAGQVTVMYLPEDPTVSAVGGRVAGAA